MPVDDRTVQALYEAASGLRPWAAALGQLQQALSPAGATQLIAFDRSSRLLALAETATGSRMDAVLEHVREYHRMDPHVAAVLAKPVGEVMNTQTDFPIARFRDHPFYREFWAPFGVCRLLGTKVYEDDQFVALAGIARVEGQPAFSDDDVAIWSRYASHLQTALRIAGHWQRARNAALVGQSLLDASPRPIFVLGAGRALISANGAAQQLLADDDTLTLREGRLGCRLAANGLALEQALSTLSAADAGPPPSGAAPAAVARRRHGVRLAGTDGATLLCSLWQAEPASTLGVFGTQEVVLLTVLRQGAAVAGARPEGRAQGGEDAEAARSHADELWLASLLELTPAEARVAGRLMRGMTIAEIAAAGERSAATVRTQVNALLAKTGARRQSELVQLLVRAAML